MVTSLSRRSFIQNNALAVVAGLAALLPGLAASESLVAAAREYANPIMAGDWSDPGVTRVGDDYYSVRSSFG